MTEAATSGRTGSGGNPPGPYVLPDELERHRKTWAEIARFNEWYREPFHVQVWVDHDGHVLDSVSFIGLEGDAVVLEEEELWT